MINGFLFNGLFLVMCMMLQFQYAAAIAEQFV